jgi:hypothetical protein
MMSRTDTHHEIVMQGSRGMWRFAPPGAGAARVSLVFVLMVLVIPAVAEAQADFGILLSPQLAQVEMSPGARTVLTFHVANTNKEKPLRVLLFPRDIRQGARGQYLLSDTAMSYSCLSWLELKDSVLELPPNASAEVSVPLRVPPGAMGGGYGAIVFEVLPPDDAGPAAGVMARATYKFQLPAFIEVSIKRSGGVMRRLRSGDIIVQTADQSEELAKAHGPDNMLVATEIENIGNVLVEAHGRIFIRDAQGRLAKLVPLGAGRGAILPGAKTVLRSIIKKLNPGTYSARTIVQYGGYSPAISEATFDVGRTSGARVGAASASMPFEVDLRPPDVRLSAPVGSFRVFGVTLINRESTPLRVTTKVEQFYHDHEGQMWTAPAMDTGRTIAPWVTYEPAEFTLDPNRPQSVRAQLSVPDSATGGYYGCLTFVAEKIDSTAKGVPTELNVPVMLTVPPALVYAGLIDQIEVERNNNGGVSVRPLVRNTGNVHTIPSGSIVIQKWSDQTSAIDSLVVLSKPTFEDVGAVAIETDSTTILPGERRLLTSQTMENLPVGRYRAVAQVRFGAGTPPVSKEKEFVIEPPTTTAVQ